MPPHPNPQAVETPDEVMMLRLLKECAAEWSARQAFPLRGWLWWANDSVADGRQKFQILHVRTGVTTGSHGSGGIDSRA